LAFHSRLGMCPGQSNIIAQDTGHRRGIYRHRPPVVLQGRLAMSYARTFRLPYRRRRTLAKPRFMRRRRATRFTRRPRRRVTRYTKRYPTRRRILQVASIKKRNAMTFSDNAHPDPSTLSSIDLTDSMNVFLWCPTYMNHEQQEQGEHVRNKEDIFFRGFKDTWTFANGTNGPWVHRRIVFWSHQQYPAGIPVQSSYAPDVFLRPLNRLDLTVLGNQKFMETIFRGTLNIDYKNYLNAVVDRRRVGLVSDEKIRHQPRYGAADADGDIHGEIIKTYTRSTFVNRRIQYDDEEKGNLDVPGDDGEEPGGPGDGSGSPWSVNGPNSPGNLYVLDMFILGVLGRPPGGALPGTVFGNISTDAVVYWHER